MNYTPNNITELKENQIFVFGSNLSGNHGKGAALSAMKWGAKKKQGSGLQGQTYGIPTKSWSVKDTLPIRDIRKFVNEFIKFAKENQQYEFLVTKIGTNLAGYDIEDIAPLFKEAMNVSNIILPKEFIDTINDSSLNDTEK